MKWKKPSSSNHKKAPSEPEITEPYQRRASSDRDKTMLMDQSQVRNVRRADGRKSGAEADGGPGTGGASANLQWPGRNERQKKVIYYKDETSADKTQIYDPTKSDGAVKESRAAGVDPVVGWFVIIAGPGRGRSIEIGVGANSIGRDANQKIALDFGDDAIHRQKHALVIFDPKSRRFFLQSGSDSRNLTYLGESLVLAPVELKGGETVVIGQTQMKFIAFCGADFCWY
jgi:hypothetical protein